MPDLIVLDLGPPRHGRRRRLPRGPPLGHDADRRALGAPRRRGEGRAPQSGRRRLHHEAVQHAGILGAGARPSAALPVAVRALARGDDRRGWAHHRSRAAPGLPRIGRDPSHARSSGRFSARSPPRRGGRSPTSRSSMRCGGARSAIRSSTSACTSPTCAGRSRSIPRRRSSSSRSRVSGIVSSRTPSVPRAAPIGGWVLWTLLLALVTIAMGRFRPDIDQAHVVLTYLLVVLGASVAGGRGFGFGMACAAFVFINYFFQQPYDTLAVGKGLELVVLFAFLATSMTATRTARPRARRSRGSGPARRRGDPALPPRLRNAERGYARNGAGIDCPRHSRRAARGLRAPSTRS